jgi:hypothetical protein
MFGILDGYRKLLLMCEFQVGCPIGNLAIELTESHARVRQLLEENFDNWKSAVRGCLEEARGKLPAENRSEDLAHFVLTVMEGAVMLARTYRTIECYDTAINVLRDYFERLQAVATDWGAKPKATVIRRKEPGKQTRPKTRFLEIDDEVHNSGNYWVMCSPLSAPRGAPRGEARTQRTRPHCAQ